MIKALNNTLVPFLRQSLNAYALRQQTIAGNIANVDTPDYSPLKVKFEENLQRAMGDKNLVGRQTDERHIALGKKTISVDKAYDELTQEQGLNLEDEMAELAKNQIKFEFAAQRLAGAYRSLRTSIFGRPA